MKLRVGDWVEIKSKEEILATLDKNGRLKELPFMPQMFEYCGQKFQVYKRAHKTCDTVYPIRGRRLSDAIHLDLRCNGAAYGGCQAACLIFWKTAWIKPVGTKETDIHPASEGERLVSIPPARTTEADVNAGTGAEDLCAPDGRRYICQATQLPSFTTDLDWWDVRQYVEDYLSGNITLGRVFSGLLYAIHKKVSWSGLGIGRPILTRPLCWLYDKFQAIRGGVPYPEKKGTIPIDHSTPTEKLDLKSGDLVQIKSYKEILATLNTENKNRGLSWNAEMVPYCDGVYKVRASINKFIDERSGKLVTLKNPSIILEDVWCRSHYSDCRMFCPRSIYSWWREIWLRRLPQSHSRPTADSRAEDSVINLTSTNIS